MAPRQTSFKLNTYLCIYLTLIFLLYLTDNTVIILPLEIKIFLIKCCDFVSYECTWSWSERVLYPMELGQISLHAWIFLRVFPHAIKGKCWITFDDGSWIHFASFITYISLRFYITLAIDEMSHHEISYITSSGMDFRKL